MLRIFRLLTLVLAFTLSATLNPVFSQGPPSPTSQANGSSTSVAPINGSGAPVGGGEYILFALAMLYATKKAYGLRNRIMT